MQAISKEDARAIFVFGVHFSRIGDSYSDRQRRILNRFAEYLQLSEEERLALTQDQFSLAQALARLSDEEARVRLIKTLCAMGTPDGAARESELEFINKVISQLANNYKLPPAEEWEGFESELAGALPVNTDRPAILVVEDDESIGQLVQFNLETEGFRVTWVIDGDSALDAIGKSRPHLVLLDVNLPGISGFEVLEAIRKRAELEGIGIIMMTAQNTESDVRMAVNLGTNGYIVKPFLPAELVRRINEVLKGSPRT